MPQRYDPVDLNEGPSGHTYPPHNDKPNPMSIPLSNMGGSHSGDPERQHAPSGSWDLLSGVRKTEHAYQEFDPTRHESHLEDGEMPQNSGASKLYNYLLKASIISRWALFIIPVMGMLWIPGILGLTSFPNAQVWNVKLLWWSIWLSVCWGGWWAALAISMILPRIIRRTIGLIAVGTRRYLDWLLVLHRYVALLLWTVAVFVSYHPLIDAQQRLPSDKARKIIDLGAKLFFAFLVCAGVLLFEKFSIQWIAGKFHERSYSERIADQKFAVKSLTTLYRYSKNVGRSDAMDSTNRSTNNLLNPSKIFKQALKGVRSAATTTTTAFGNVASEITGTSVLQPNSPQAVVQTALESANRSRLLARRLFYSFAKPNAEMILLEDIARYFPVAGEAENVFALFDKDSNGDASREEVEIAVMEFHREQQSIEHSMRDLDSAVGRLDNIFMSLYVVIAVLIIAVALEAQVATLVTSAGTLVLGLSWLIGGTLSEVLTSIIFLFVKHPFDVGDRVCVDHTHYTVKEIRLLSTIFLNSDGIYVQAPNTVLNSQFIQNIRRSPQTSESFKFDISYSTSFESIELLRKKMLAFLESEKRDYQPSFDVTVVDFPDQAKMTLQADIKYKSNGQQGALKAKRRNKWVCALKESLGAVGIFGPGGDPNGEPGTQRYTKVPWDDVRSEAERAKQVQGKGVDLQAPVGGWRLTEENAVVLDGTDDIFDNPDELHRSTPMREFPRPQEQARPPPGLPMTMPSAMYMPPSSDGSSH